MMKWLLALTVALPLCSCAYPKSSIQQGTVTALYVPHAPADATLSIDGKTLGLASQYDGKTRSYQVEPGRHAVLVRGPSGILLQKSIYIGSGSTLALEWGQ